MGNPFNRGAVANRVDPSGAMGYWGRGMPNFGQPRTAVSTPFSDYTGRSVGNPVGQFRRVAGFGQQFRG